MAIYLGDTLLTGPSGGTGASLTADQTFTGANTFTDTAVFSNITAGIKTNRIEDTSNGTTHIRFADNVFSEGMTFITDSVEIMHFEADSSGAVITINNGRVDVDFSIRKQTSGVAFEFDAGTDTLSSAATNFTGIADQESGTWTPTFTNGGTQGTINASYTRAGKTVTISCNGAVAASTSTSSFTVNASSLPFAPISSRNFYGGYGTAGGGSSLTGVFSIGDNDGFFAETSTSTLKGNGLLGTLIFSATYETT